MDPADAVDHVAIGALQAAYGDAVTRRDWPAVVALFAPDATVTLDLGRGEPRVLGPVELVAFVEEAISRFDLFLFTILNRVVLDVAGDDATGRVWLAEIRQDADNNLVLLKVQPGKPFVYYSGSGWNLGQDNVRDRAAWDRMVAAEPVDFAPPK
jgi:ketosteroid isomerase-like protein